MERDPQMTLKHRVTYYSQDALDGGMAPVWGAKCCGIACLAMYLYRHHPRKKSLNDLLQHGLAIGAYSPRGWIHEKLHALAAAYGVAGDARAIENDFAQFCAILQGGSVLIASVTHQFPVDGRMGGHLVLVYGYHHAGTPSLYINDPSRWGRSVRRVGFARFAHSFSGRIVTLA